METKKRTQATDIAEIATKLDGKVKFSSIIYSQQMLSEKYRETGVNDMYFIGKKFGLWFYTSRAALDNLCYLQNPKFPTWVLCENSFRKEWIAENPADEWIARNVNWATERQKELNAIAYLQPGE